MKFKIEDVAALGALADRVEALEGPDREVDAEIAVHIFGADAVRKGGVGWPEGALVVPCYPGWRLLPNYTASIDAAATLVPENAGWCISVNGRVMGKAIQPQAHVLHNGSKFISAATPALALCAAALRAIQEANNADPS